jgi:hypothetical protein
MAGEKCWVMHCGSSGRTRVYAVVILENCGDAQVEGDENLHECD